MGLLSSARRTFSHGIHPAENKLLTAGKNIRRMLFPPEVVVPLSQHFGAAAIALVRKGQDVVRGEPIARADGFLSVPHHAPVTGTVKCIELAATARGPKVQSIVIRVQPGAGQNVLYGDSRDLVAMSQQETIQAIQDTGMVGLGGAAFPTHAKLSVPANHAIDNLIVNGCECEPHLTADHRIMLEKVDELIQGISIAQNAANAPQAIIGIEDNKLDAYEKIRDKLPPDGPIRIQLLRTKYPQGAEKMLIKSLLNREVPSGGLPYQVGVVVQNVSTLAQLGELLPLRRGLIERVVTISGPGIEDPGNYLIPLGTPLRFVLERAGYTGSVKHLIMGGPMMGMAVASLDVPVTKAVSGIVVMNKEEEARRRSNKTRACIKCGICLTACPVKLNPSQLGLLAAKRQYETMEKQYHLNDCFECGCCSYVCPSAIPLVQYFRIAKAINRDLRDKAAG